MKERLKYCMFSAGVLFFVALLWWREVAIISITKYSLTTFKCGFYMLETFNSSMSNFRVALDKKTLTIYIEINLRRIEIIFLS